MKGIYYDSIRKTWISSYGRTMRSPRFKTEKEAAEWRQSAEQQYGPHRQSNAIDKIKIQSVPISNGCLEYRASGTGGYSRVTFQGKRVHAHVASYCIANNVLLSSLRRYDICHTCDNRKCVNPQHLFKGTRKDNLDDMTHKGRRAKHEKHGSAKLSWSEVDEIRNDCRSLKSIANDYGVSFQLIGLIKQGKIWRR